MKKCKICGLTDKETRVIGDLCRKHYLQIYRYGKVFRTRYDANAYELIDDTYYKITMYDKQGNVSAYTLIDKDDYNKCCKHKWKLSHGYATTHEGTKTIFLHRVIMEYNGNQVVDHINHDKLDNRRSNLRIVSKSVNASNNYKKYSGIKQVPSGRYQCVICFNNKNIYLGTFDNADEALAVRKQKLEELYGFAI